MVTIVLNLSVIRAKSRSDIPFFVDIAAVYVTTRISSGDFSVSSLSKHQRVPES